jgi:GLPGLI family protein
MRRLLPLTLLAALSLVTPPSSTSAQEGRVTYSRAVQYDFEVPEGWAEMKDQIPSQVVTEMVLLFNGQESVMTPLSEPEQRAASDVSERSSRMAEGLRRGSSSRSDQETLLESYVRFEDGAMTETREFVGRTFLISGARPTYQWQLSADQRELLGFVVQKATATHEGSEIEAWFTMQVPVEAGPGPFGGLPGLILLVSVDEGRTFYAATEVDLSGLGDGDETISPPSEGSEVTLAEYEVIVAEKLEEIATTSRASDRRRPFQ